LALVSHITQRKKNRYFRKKKQESFLTKDDAKIKKYVVTQDGVTVTFDKQEDTNWAIEGMENADINQISNRTGYSVPSKHLV
jgi:hypothetical protein